MPAYHLTSAQLGLEPCGFCGGDECAVKLDHTGNGRFKILSSCRYAYTSFNYDSARVSTKSSPCTNIPVTCPFCSSAENTHYIWKYNAISHVMANHPDKALPLEFVAEIHIHLREADLMKVTLDGMKLYRKANSLMDSDDLPQEPVSTVGDKRSRAPSTSSAGGSRKNPRFE